MSNVGKEDEKLRRCPICKEVTLLFHAKAEKWICRNCGYESPLPDQMPDRTTQESAEHTDHSL